MKTRIKIIKNPDGTTKYQPQKTINWVYYFEFPFLMIIYLSGFRIYEDIGFGEDTLLEAKCVIDRRIERYKKEKQKPKISYIKYP